MSRSPPTFKQADLARAVRAAQSVGLEVVQTKIEPDGTITLLHKTPLDPATVSPFDKWKAGRRAN